MYAQFFGLKREPFSIAPDPRYLYMSERHREALAHLLYGVEGGGGFVLLTGEIGAGKTTVCRAFLEQVPRKCNVAYIFNPKLTVMELLQSVCEEFHIPLPDRDGVATVKHYVDPLNSFLLRTHAVGQHNLLIIDEAQNLSAEVLEQLRLLTNLETAQRKLLQIVLIGQPELRDMLARPELEQLAQRVIARYHLQALGPKETSHYIAHRLAVAGLKQGLPFDRAARARIHELSRGVPRRINLLCDRALLGAYGSGQSRVDTAIVDKAAGEVFGSDDAPRRAARWQGRRAILIAAGAACGVVALGLAVLLWERTGDPPPGVAQFASSASAPAGALTASSSMPTALAVSAAASGTAPSIPGEVVSERGGADGVAAPTAPASEAAPQEPFDASQAVRLGWRTEAEAWRELARGWNVTLEAGDPCQVGPRQQMQCFRTSNGLAFVRQLDRPGVVPLWLPGERRPVYALLVGLDGQRASLRLGASTQALAVSELASIWRGDFATFWRAPAGVAAALRDGITPAVARWLNGQLARADGTAGLAASEPAATDGLKARLVAFQLAQGLRPDGLLGPTTFMQLNRANGVDEPRLRAP